MLIDLLSTSNYVSFNIKLAHTLGLQSAIYLSELMNITEKAIRKKKIEDGYVTLDRKYFTSRTTLTETEQYQIENRLSKIELVSRLKDDKDKVSLNINVLTTMMLEENEKLIGDISKITKKKDRKSGVETRKQNLINIVKTENLELRKAYKDWIESILEKYNGFMPDATLKEAERVIDEFSNHNLDVAIKLLQIAAAKGQRDLHWAINDYKQYYQHNIPKVEPKVKDEIYLGRKI